MSSIINWFKRVYLDMLIWYDSKKLEKYIKNELRVTFEFESSSYYQNDVDKKYAEGLFAVKNKINKAVKNNDKDEYEKTLENIKELINLAKDETPNQKRLRKAFERLYVRKGADVKTRKDKSKMIDSRIKHFQDLKEHKQKRELLRSIRKLKAAGEFDQAEKLEQEWRDLNGPKK